MEKAHQERLPEVSDIELTKAKSSLPFVLRLIAPRMRTTFYKHQRFPEIPINEWNKSVIV
jgi:hypothetical protein